MRRVILAVGLFLFLANAVSAGQQYIVFSKDGKEGLKDALGKEIIPAVYEKLGWTDGEFRLIADLVGFRSDGKWGLVNLKNKEVQPAVYYQLQVFDDKHILAAVRGTFTSRLFYGLIDDSGEVQISCRYLDVEALGNQYLVYDLGQTGNFVGLVSDKYELILPLKYERIERVTSDVLAARDFRNKWRFFDNEGQALIADFADDFRVLEGLILFSKSGRVGALSTEGKLVQPPLFKSVSPMESLPFAQWEVRNLDLSVAQTYDVDSLKLVGDLFLTYTNGTQEVIIDAEDLFGDRLVEIRQARSGFLVSKDLQSQKWMLSTTTGKVISEGKDSIAFDGIYFYGLSEDGWEVYNRFGRKISAKNFEQVDNSINGLIPVKRNDYWGIIDFQGNQVVGFKFDSIAVADEEYIRVNYLGNWGLIDGYGDWQLQPEYQQILVSDESVVAFKKPTTYIFGKDLQALGKISSRPYPADGFIELRDEDDSKGIISPEGQIVSDAIYDAVQRYGDRYFGYRDEFVVMLSPQGEILMPLSDRVTDVYGVSEEWFKIKKDGKYGFVDQNGKLRIANRYDEAGFFSEDRCPVMLNERWGYVDKLERLVIQPLYQEARAFENGLAIVKQNGQYGLIDAEGDEVIIPQYREIIYKKGLGYLLYTDEGKVGVADNEGMIRLRANYDHIEVVSDSILLIVYQEGKAGILSAEGYQKVPFDYDRIEVQGDYFFMRKID